MLPTSPWGGTAPASKARHEGKQLPCVVQLKVCTPRQERSHSLLGPTREVHKGNRSLLLGVSFYVHLEHLYNGPTQNN